MSGLSAMNPNCSSRLSPPTSKTHFKSVPFPSSFTTFRVCRASSLEGDIIKALAPTFALCPFSFSIIGTTNAAVFPDPVLAIPTTSCPSRTKGIVLRWIGVGIENPFLVIALSRLAFNPIAWKPPPFLTLLPLIFEALRFEAACVAAMKSASSDPLSRAKSGIPSPARIRAFRSGCWVSTPSSAPKSLTSARRASDISASVADAAGEGAR